MNEYKRVIDIRNEVNPYAKSMIIPEEWKPNIDQLMVVDYMNANRYYAEHSPTLQEDIEQTMHQEPEVFYQNIVNAWQAHHEFFERHLEVLMVKQKDYTYSELSPTMIDLLIDQYKKATIIDEETMVYSASIKKYVSHHSEILAHNLGMTIEDFTSQFLRTSTYFGYYTAKNLIYVLEQTEDNAEKDSLAMEFHGGDPDIMKHRHQLLAQKYKNRIPNRILQTYEQDEIELIKPNEVSDTDWREIVALRKCVEFDNIEEYMIAINLEGASGYILRKMIAKHLVDAGIIDERSGIYDYSDEETILGLQELKNQNSNSYTRQVEAKVQHGITCSAACATMAESVVFGRKPTNQVESMYASASGSKYIPGQHYSYMAAEMLGRGLDVTIVHELETHFKRGFMSGDLFSKLNDEYNAGLALYHRDSAAEELNGQTINSIYVTKLLERGDTIILAGQNRVNEYYHSVFIVGKNGDKFVVIDPFYGNFNEWSQSELESFSETDIGKWLIAVSGKLSDRESRRYYHTELGFDSRLIKGYTMG